VRKAIVFVLLVCAKPGGWILIIGDETLKVKILTGDYELRLGLKFRTHLSQDSAYLFLFPHPERYPFWMKDTYIPLSIGFIDTNYRLIAIDSMFPNDTTLIFPPQPIIMAIETNQGWFKDHQVKVGDRIHLFKLK